MSKVGFQDFWLAGCNLYFKRDPIDAVVQEWFDFGTLQSVTPAMETEEVELFDASGGRKVKVDSAILSVDETYDVTCSNLNLKNLQFVFLSTPPEAFTQTAAVKDVDHLIHRGALLKIHDSDAAQTPLFALSVVAGMYTDTVAPPTIATRVISSIVASTKTITVTVAVTLADNDTIIVAPDNMVNPLNAGTYTVNGAVTAGLTIVVDEAFVSDETFPGPDGRLLVDIGGASVVIHKKGGANGWSDSSLPRGFVKIPDHADFEIFGGITTVVYATAAVSGKRKLRPQSIKGEIQGTALLFWNRSNNTDMTVRVMRVAVRPSALNTPQDQFSDFVVSMTVLSDITDEDAGELIQIAGTLPPATS